METDKALRRAAPMGRRVDGGFSLIELLVTVAIVAILAAIALPSYQAYLVRGNRAAAQSFMMEIASKQQLYLLDTRGYTNSLANLDLSVPGDVSPYYTISITSNVATEFTITATPVAGSAQSGDGNLTLDHLGNKTPADKWS